MTRFWKAAALFGVVGMAVVMTRFAWAERVISDYEASKLTFSALVAPPSAYHHRAARQVVARHSAPARTQLAMHRSAPAFHSSASMVRNVAFRGHVVSPHARHTHKRHG